MSLKNQKVGSNSFQSIPAPVPNQHIKKSGPRVAVYARCSTHEQSVDAQLSELRKYCDARGWTISYEFKDEGKSGKDIDRIEFQKLLKLSRQRKIDVVVTTALDRAFRNLKNLVNTLDEWNALNISFVAIRDCIDYSTPQGKMFLQLTGILAEFERSLIVARVKAGLLFAREKGVVLGRPQTNDYEKIRELRRQGFSYAKIQKVLGVSKGAVYRALTAAPETPPKSANTKKVKTGVYDG